MKRRARHFTLMIGFSLGLASCTTDREDVSFENPLDPAVGSGLPVPESLDAVVGDNVVELSWALPEGESADEFAVFRLRVDVGGEEERLVDRVSESSYRDSNVRNERTYEYRIASGVAGQFGPRSDAIAATPGLFTILIAGDVPVTGSRDVAVTGNALGATAIQLSEALDDDGAPWRPLGGTITFTLSGGDGMKTVYGRFRLSDGSVTLPAMDSIRLDTRAVIETVDFDGAEVREPGDTVHFRIVTGERDGVARINVTGVFTNVRLFDDGSAGDTVAGDGTYERDLVIPAGTSAVEESVRGTFVDEAGNQADPVNAPRLLTAQSPLESVEITEVLLADPPDAASVTLRWSRYTESDFSRYRIVRSDSSPVTETDEQVGTLSSASALEFEDTDVVEGLTYHYRVFVEDRQGRQAGSGERAVLVPNERPPSAVTIESTTATSTDRVSLSWSRSTARDFASYRLYRNETGAVTDQDEFVAEILDVETHYFDDSGLTENTTYYYRVYTVDQGGLSARSAETSVTTANEAPLPVFLEASQIDSTAATLSWLMSPIHDFSRYELYRDTIPTVTRGSTLLVELDDPSFTSYRDEDMEADTLYYFRVFVVDDADDAGFAGSNTVPVTTTPRVSP